MVATVPAPARQLLFVSHSKHDADGQSFLLHVFNRDDSRWRPIFYAVEGPKAPHAGSILQHLCAAGALAVLLSPELERSKHTRSWVGFEVGIAAQRGLPILVVERPDEDTDFPVPGVTHYARRLKVATSLDKTSWAAIARTDFAPVEPEEWDASGEGFLTKAAAFFYNLGLKTQSVEGKFSSFTCNHRECRANYFVEEGILGGKFRCPSCRSDTGAPSVLLQEGLMKWNEAAQPAQAAERRPS